MSNKSGHRSVKIHPGLAIYRLDASPYFYARIWLSRQRKYLVRTTGEKSQIKAIKVAREFFNDLMTNGELDKIDRKRTFAHFAEQMTHPEVTRARSGDGSLKGALNRENYLFSPNIGLSTTIGHKDVADLRGSDLDEFLSDRDRSRSKPLAAQTKNIYIYLFNKVLRYAYERGALDHLPVMPSQNRKRSDDTPRVSFSFSPLVSKEHDEYQKLLGICKELADSNEVVRGTPITNELYDVVLFIVHSFVRPTMSELYAIKHEDVQIKDNPRRLTIRIKQGKTGFRYVDTLPAAVSVYNRIVERNPSYKSADYIFLNDYPNRETAKRVISRQFIKALEASELRVDPQSGEQRSLYSLRHTAIQMRLVKSGGRVNIFNLARNAGTSVDQIERFYAKFLPGTNELAENLQTFGD